MKEFYKIMKLLKNRGIHNPHCMITNFRKSDKDTDNDYKKKKNDTHI